VASNSTTRPLPGRHTLPREFIARHQRVRIVNGLALEASAKGYRAVTVADVVRRAGIARNTFYENFERAGSIDEWPLRIRAGLAAFLSYVAAEPALARTCMVEALAAGPAAVHYYEESLQAFVSLFRVGRDVSPAAGALPETLEEALIGGIFWIVYQRLLQSEAATIEELLPELVEFALTPYLGAEASRRVAAGDDGQGPRSEPAHAR
jgi:AcrR family transcriptional regulator